jgi:hypothetical protein
MGIYPDKLICSGPVKESLGTNPIFVAVKRADVIAPVL